MNSQKQIVTIGAIFMIVFSILFFNVRAEYSNESYITNLEIRGMKKITDIHNLDILLKNIRGINQLESKDATSLKTSLMITDDNVLVSIKKLEDKAIENLYLNIINKNNKLSKMELFNQYSRLLKLLTNKRIDIADSSYLLFEADREIYFLITTTVLDIPETIEFIGKIRGIGVGILSNHSIGIEEESFLLKTNIHTFMTKIEQIKYTISKLNADDKTILNSLLNSIISDFYNLKEIVSSVEENRSLYKPKEYFLETSKLVNKINDFYSVSSDVLTKKLRVRESELQTKLILGTLFYIILMLLSVLTIYINFKKSHKDEKEMNIKREQHKFISMLQSDYSKEQNLKQICDKTLNHIINHFGAINGSLYLFDEDNDKLYLGATYAIKYDSLNQTLDLHENLISENILEKKIKILDINQKVNLGSIETIGSKLVTVPIMEFEKSIGTVQLVFDDTFNSINMEFLETVISLMGTYINKAQKDEESSRYLKLIDKSVLISKTDLDGNITEVSEQLCNLSQYSKESLIGKTHRVFKHKDMGDDIFVDMWNIITKGESWHGEMKNRKKDGSFYWIDSTITPDCDINGNVIGYTALRVDITDKKQVEEIAITDGLTSLYNRRHFDNIFPQQIEIAKRAKGILAFVLIDIDHFKQYNDTYGHQDGDTALKLVAKALKDTLKRPDDYTFRLGGEEFGLVYHIKNKDDGYDIANQAKINIENLKIDHTGNSASKYVTISSGLYIIDNSNNDSVDEIYKKSDEALYVAKQSGRNQVKIVK